MIVNIGTAAQSASGGHHSTKDVPPAQAGLRGHLDYIDGLRGLAILTVLLYHFWQEARCPFAYWWNPLSSGYDGVNLFLVVSGFCLYWPLVRPGRPAPEPSLAEFARRRAHRLLPPYYVAVGMFTLVALVTRGQGWRWLEGPGGPAAILTTAGWHLALLHNLRPQHIWTLDGPLWTVALEASLYVAMPILVVVARKTRIEWAVALAAVVTLAYRLAVDRFVGGTAGWQAIGADYSFVLADFLPGRWLEFALGMWAATLVAGGAGGKGRTPFGLLALTCFVPNLWLRERFGQHNPFSEPIFGLSFFFLILQAARAPVGAWGLAHRALRVRPLVWLGGISYSVYLIHYPVLKMLVAVSSSYLSSSYLTRDRNVIGICLFFFLPIILGTSYLFFLLVERRFLNAPRRRQAPAPGAPSEGGAAADDAAKGIIPLVRGR